MTGVDLRPPHGCAGGCRPRKTRAPAAAATSGGTIGDDEDARKTHAPTPTPSRKAARPFGKASTHAASPAGNHHCHAFFRSPQPRVSAAQWMSQPKSRTTRASGGARRCRRSERDERAIQSAGILRIVKCPSTSCEIKRIRREAAARPPEGRRPCSNLRATSRTRAGQPCRAGSNGATPMSPAARYRGRSACAIAPVNARREDRQRRVRWPRARDRRR